MKTSKKYWYYNSFIKLFQVICISYLKRIHILLALYKNSIIITMSLIMSDREHKYMNFGVITYTHTWNIHLKLYCSFQKINNFYKHSAYFHHYSINKQSINQNMDNNEWIKWWKRQNITDLTKKIIIVS